MEGKNKEKDGPSATSVVEQWICFLLAVACIVCGLSGLCIKHDEVAIHAQIAWLGRAYLPALRGIAIACLLLGAALMRKARSKQ